MNNKKLEDILTKTLNTLIQKESKEKTYIIGGKKYILVKNGNCYTKQEVKQITA